MDITLQDAKTILGYVVTFLATSGGLILYYRPKVKRIEAETEGQNLKNLESALDTLTAAYEKRLEITEGNYTIEINGIRRQQELQQREIEALNKKLDETEKVYKVDRERLAIYEKVAEKMKLCTNFKTCIGAKEFHLLTRK